MERHESLGLIKEAAMYAVTYGRGKWTEEEINILIDDLREDHETPFTAREIPDETLRVWREDEMFRDRYEAAIDAALCAREDLTARRTAYEAEKEWLASMVSIYGKKLAGNPGGRFHREGYYETPEQALEAAKRECKKL